MASVPEMIDGLGLFALVGLPFVAVGLFRLVGRFFWDAARRRRTRYALTDRRAIIATSLGGRHLLSLPIHPDRDVEYRPGREATIILDRKVTPSRNRRKTGPAVTELGFERIADIPLYSADPIVRRAPSLQRTKDAKVGAAWFNAQSLAAVGVAEGASVRLKTPTGDVVLPAALDSTLPDACVRLPGAQAATAELGALTGLISVERA